MAITRSAPSSMAALAAIWPTPPQPQTATTSPGRTPPRSAPIQPVGAESEANSAVMSSTSSGTGKAIWSANGSRTYSAWLPLNPPMAWE
jgi:hypothetical protein